jgi:predicted membrane channel-forming protein YqfA (hemolysin III family)
MFETLETAHAQKAVSPRLARLFFGIYALTGAFGTFLDFHRHGLHRPVLLGLEITMSVVSVAWLRNYWNGLSAEKFKGRFLFFQDVWYS